MWDELIKKVKEQFLGRIGFPKEINFLGSSEEDRVGDSRTDCGREFQKKGEALKKQYSISKVFSLTILKEANIIFSLPCL